MGDEKNKSIPFHHRLPFPNIFCNTIPFKELIKLNANIPIVSKNKHDIPLKDRKSWHHYWLIDCSEEKYLSADSSCGYVVNVALVEDGKPYIGIVYASRDDVLYYSALDKGAFKVVDHQKPISINNGLMPSKPAVERLFLTLLMNVTSWN